MAGLYLLIILLTLSQSLSFYVIAKRLDAIERAIRELSDLKLSIVGAIREVCEDDRDA